jgi:hypothetical protein
VSNIRSTKVLRSAKGQPCSARFPGICNGNADTTVWAHLNGAAFGKGAWIKAHDVLGFHACYSCHAYYDVGHGTKAWLDNETLLECILRAVCETWVRLITAGIIFVPQDEPKPFADRPVKPRKPKSERRPVPKGKPLTGRGFDKGPRPFSRLSTNEPKP